MSSFLRWSHSVYTFLVAMLVMVCASTPSQASVSFTLDGYNVTANQADPGLLMSTAPVLTAPYSFSLEVGGPSHTVALFDIWTTEDFLHPDDYTDSPIEVEFSFTAPPPAFGGSASGETGGEIDVAVTGVIFVFTQATAELSWNGPLDLTFGPNNDGIVRIELSDETFNTGDWSLYNPTPPFGSVGSTVEATFTLLAAPTEAMPEPTALIVWGGLAFAGAAAVGRRR